MASGMDITNFYEGSETSDTYSHQVVTKKKSISTGVTEMNDLFRDIDISLEGNDKVVRALSARRFKDKLSGGGMYVKKVSSGKAELIPRKIRYMGKYLYISSMTGESSVAIDTIIDCVSSGKVVTIKADDGFEISLRTPSITDAVAIRNVLGNKTCK